MCCITDKPTEACGVMAILGPGGPVAGDIYGGLFCLQHRGQQSAGIATANEGEVFLHKNLGLVTEVFTPTALEGLPGRMGIGHVHYATQRNNTPEDAQPLRITHAKGELCVAYNGNITNSAVLRQGLADAGAVFQTHSDVELIAHQIARVTGAGDIAEALTLALPSLKGAYSLVAMSNNRLFAARDPHGFRPLCIGRRDKTWIIASESCAFGLLEAQFVRDVAPGEVLELTNDGPVTLTQIPNDPTICVFEYIYFARPDSFIDGTSVYQARHDAGRFLAQQSPVEADLVVGVPDSGIICAIGYAAESGIPYGLAFDKNRYIGRTFIAPTQRMREQAVRMKLSVINENVRGKRIIMTDDSIVRGTTCAKIIKLLKAAGAKEVHVRISSPPYKWPCYFGTDISDRDQLTANTHSLEELCTLLGADSLAYLNQESLPDILATKAGFCQGCFTGNYPK